MEGELAIEEKNQRHIESSRLTIVSTTPWYNELEWLYVYEGLFGPNKTSVEKKEALARISVWELRSLDTPISISVTKLLMEAKFFDECFGTLDSYNKLQMLYSLAIMRFVNCYVDIEQKKLYAESISLIAQKIGIPSEIVDCRHRITHHNQLPSLELLRHVTHLSLEYIQSTYWDPQAKVLYEERNVSERGHYLVLGLVAVQLDVEYFTKEFEFLRDQSLVWLDSSKTKCQVSPESLLLTCFLFSSINPKKRQNESCAQFLNLTAQTLQNIPCVTKALASAAQVPSLLTKVFTFTSWLLETFTYDLILVSFLKDFFFLVVDPESPESFLLISLAFWILSSLPTHWFHSFVGGLLDEILAPETMVQTLNTQAPSSHEGTTKQDSTVSAPFDSWYQIYLQEKVHEEKLPAFQCKRERYMAWLRCLVLLPGNDSRSPFPFFLLCPLFALRGTSMTETKQSTVVKKPLKDIFPLCVLQSFLLIRKRVIDFLKWSSRGLCRKVIGQYYGKGINQDSPSKFLDLFCKIGLKNSFCVSLLRHFHQAGRNKGRAQVGSHVTRSPSDPLHQIVEGFLTTSLSPKQVREALRLLRINMSRKNSCGVRCVSTTNLPWTEPGTTMRPSETFFSFSLYKSFTSAEEEKTVPLQQLLRQVYQEAKKHGLKRSSQHKNVWSRDKTPPNDGFSFQWNDAKDVREPMMDLLSGK